jgi:hypothetical protein
VNCHYQAMDCQKLTSWPALLVHRADEQGDAKEPASDSLLTHTSPCIPPRGQSQAPRIQTAALGVAAASLRVTVGSEAIPSFQVRT